MKAATLPVDSGHSEPSETSPLLSAQRDIDPAKAHLNGAVDRDVESHVDNAPDACRHPEPCGSSDGQSQAKYILPALSLGVCIRKLEFCTALD